MGQHERRGSGRGGKKDRNDEGPADREKGKQVPGPGAYLGAGGLPMPRGNGALFVGEQSHVDIVGDPRTEQIL